MLSALKGTGFVRLVYENEKEEHQIILINIDHIIYVKKVGYDIEITLCNGQTLKLKGADYDGVERVILAARKRR